MAKVKRSGNAEYYKLMDAAADLHETKNQDYCGESDYEGMDNFVGAAARANVSVRDVFAVMRGIKAERLRALAGRGANHESADDTRVDDLNYTALEIAFERTFGDLIDKPLRMAPVIMETGEVV